MTDVDNKPTFYGFYCSCGDSFCPLQMDKYCTKYEQELVFNGKEYERCSKCLIQNKIGSLNRMGSFYWAVHELYNGEKIRRNSWDIRSYVCIPTNTAEKDFPIAHIYSNGGFMVVEGYSFKLKDIIAFDWDIVK